MSKDSAHIDWSYTGKTNLAFGTGATREEALLGWGACLLGVALYAFFYITRAFPWTPWQYLLAAALAFDACGGMVANSLNSGKRFYSSPPRADESRVAHQLKHHLFFTALHIHPLIIGWLFGSGNWLFGLFWYAGLVMSVLVVQNVSLYLRRPVAMFIILGAILVNATFLLPPLGFAWFVPVLFIKVVYGHSVREEPYRPDVKIVQTTH